MAEHNISPDIDATLDRLSRGNDTVAAILGGSLLDLYLERLLISVFVNDATAVRSLMGSEGGHAPIGTLSAKIDLAYCLGLIPGNMRKDLHIVRRIRNKFAHKIDHVTFGDNQIRDLCQNLDIVKHLSSSTIEPRRKFTFTVAIIGGSLAAMADNNAWKMVKIPDDLKVATETDGTVRAFDETEVSNHPSSSK